MNEQRKYSYFGIIRCLRFVKFLYDIGIYDEAVGDIQEIGEDDYYELAIRGLENVAPIFGVEELGEDVCCGGHVIYHFSDPDIPEYYRLCRLYEHKHGIGPSDNPYVKKADDFYNDLCAHSYSDFYAGYNDDVHIRNICIETCPERPFDEKEVIELINYLLEYYRSEVETLRAELLTGPIVWLPALPEHKEAPKTKKTRKKADKPLKKAS